MTADPIPSSTANGSFYFPPQTGLGRVRLYGRLGSRHSGLSGAEGLLTATLLTDTEQWTNGSKGRVV